MIITGSLAAALRLGLRDSVIVTVLDSDPSQVPGRVRVTSPPGRRGSDSESVTRRPGPGVTHMMRPVRRTSLSDSHSLPVSLTESHGVWPGPGRRQLWILHRRMIYDSSVAFLRLPVQRTAVATAVL